MTDDQRLSEAEARAGGRNGQRKLPNWRLEALKTTFWADADYPGRRRRSSLSGDIRDRLGGVPPPPPPPVLDRVRERGRRPPGAHRHRGGGDHRGRRRVLDHHPGLDAGITTVRPPDDAQLRPRRRQPGHAGHLRRPPSSIRCWHLVSITSDPDQPDFVPHLSITVAEALLLVDLAVLIYFIHHIAKSIQLPEVIAGIARDLIRAIDAEFPVREADDELADARQATRSRCPNCSKLLDDRGGHRDRRLRAATCSSSATPSWSTSRREQTPSSASTIGPGTSSWLGGPGNGMAPRGSRAGQVGLGQGTRDRARTGRSCRIPFLPSISSWRSRSGPVTGSERYVHRTYVHRLALCRSQQALRTDAGGRLSTGTGFGRVRLIGPTRRTQKWSNRAFDKVRQAARGMPAVIIRLLHALAVITEQTTSRCAAARSCCAKRT